MTDRKALLAELKEIVAQQRVLHDALVVASRKGFELLARLQASRCPWIAIARAVARGAGWPTGVRFLKMLANSLSKRLARGVTTRPLIRPSITGANSRSCSGSQETEVPMDGHILRRETVIRREWLEPIDEADLEDGDPEDGDPDGEPGDDDEDEEAEEETE
jgi:hypothetical protein